MSNTYLLSAPIRFTNGNTKTLFGLVSKSVLHYMDNTGTRNFWANVVLCNIL